MRRSWRRCIGIEALAELHALALARNAHAAAAVAAAHESSSRSCRSCNAPAIAPCEMRWLDVTAENALDALGAVDVLFAFSTCFDNAKLAAVLAAGLRPPARVITIDSLVAPEEQLAGEPRERSLGASGDGGGFQLLQRYDDVDICCEVSEELDLARSKRV